LAASPTACEKLGESLITLGASTTELSKLLLSVYPWQEKSEVSQLPVAAVLYQCLCFGPKDGAVLCMLLVAEGLEGLANGFANYRRFTCRNSEPKSQGKQMKADMIYLIFP